MKHRPVYALCPRCGRAVPLRLGERYCVNDGAPLLLACAGCGQPIRLPYTRFCASCGRFHGEPSPVSPLV